MKVAAISFNEGVQRLVKGAVEDVDDVARFVCEGRFALYGRTGLEERKVGVDQELFHDDSAPSWAYELGMAYELDDIRVSDECPGCGRGFTVTYKTLRLGRTIECQGCGETIRLEDATPIAAVQALIDEQDEPGRDDG